jgi:energy-coupling factor transporter ATP-binding protein EcfA2
MSGSNRRSEVGPIKAGKSPASCDNLAVTTKGHQSSLAEGLSDLAIALESLDLLEGGASLDVLSARRDRLVRSIRTYSIPRLSGDAGPLLVVFAGPTGSGKSTLINSLAGLEFSETGPLRPTTTGPVVLAGNQHISMFDEISGIECRVIEGGAPILDSIALVDTPDLDSTSIENRAKAEILMDNADVVVFVTSAIRYADLVPWEVLRRASSRGAPVINVINRLGAGSSGAVTDFRARLSREGVDVEVVRVPEHHIQAHRHRLPGVAVRELQRRILAKATEIVEDRREVVDRVVRSTAAQVLELAGELESLLEFADEDSERGRNTLEGAARMLDLSPLCDGLSPGDPPAGIVTGLIWEWRNRLGVAEWEDVAATMCRRLVAIVEGDIRQAVARDSSVGAMSPQIVEEFRSLARSLAEDWLMEVSELAAGHRLGGRLATVVLADCAVARRRTAAFDRIFEDDSRIVRAQRALLGPLEHLYVLIGSQMREHGRRSASRNDPDRLRQLASAVSARSHFADA